MVMERGGAWWLVVLGFLDGTGSCRWWWVVGAGGGWIDANTGDNDGHCD